MAYGLPNGHVTDDVTWPRNVLWSSTVGCPSDSLASCSYTSRSIVPCYAAAVSDSVDRSHSTLGSSNYWFETSYCTVSICTRLTSRDNCMPGTIELKHFSSVQGHAPPMQCISLHYSCTERLAASSLCTWALQFAQKRFVSIRFEWIRIVEIY